VMGRPWVSWVSSCQSLEVLLTSFMILLNISIYIFILFKYVK
jgi:hypothetical protein